MPVKIILTSCFSGNIKKKHGRDITRVARKLEYLINKHSKIQLDINFREDLRLTFAKANVAIKYGTQKLKMKIARAVMETEIQNKHDRKRKFKKQIWDIKFQLKSSLTLILYNTLLQRINVVVKSRVKAITTGHLSKFSNLCNKRSTYSSNRNHISFSNYSVFNMSSYTLTEDEYNALAFGLDHHIPTRTNKNIIGSELEFYFQSINRFVNDIPDNKIVTSKKTKKYL